MGGSSGVDFGNFGEGKQGDGLIFRKSQLPARPSQKSIYSPSLADYLNAAKEAFKQGAQPEALESLDDWIRRKTNPDQLFPARGNVVSI